MSRTIRSIADDLDDIYVYPTAGKIRRPAMIYAIVDGELYHFPVKEKHIG